MKTYSILCAFILSITIPFSSQAKELKIVALINGEIISSEDMQNNLNYFLVTSKIPMNQQTRNMILQRVLNSTIDDKIKLQATKNDGIEITPAETNNAVINFERSNKIPQGQMKNILKQGDISYKTFEDKMTTDLAWLRFIKRKNMMNGELTQKEIETAFGEATTDLSTPKYLISEIFIKEENAKDLDNLINNLRKDNRFDLYAMQFSDSPSSANGGNLGWVNQGKLPLALEMKLVNMKPGDITDPTLVGDGYYILKLQKTFNPKTDEADLPNQKEIKMFLENQQMEALSKKLLQNLRQRAVIEIRS